MSGGGSGGASNAGASGSGSGGGGGGGGGGAPCGACKFLRRKCVSDCIFAPYFDAEQGAAHFAAVHKIFGASNVSKLLQMIPACKRCEAVVTICYEAQARLKDPVYGCVAHIFALQQQVVNLQAELAFVQAQLASRMAASGNESCSISMSSASYNPGSNYEAAAHLQAQQGRSSCSVVKQEPSAFSGGLSGYNPNHHMLLDILGSAGYSGAGAAGHEGHSSQAPLHRSSRSQQQQQQLMHHNILHRQHHHHGSDAGVGMGVVGEDLQALAQELLRRNMPMPGAAPLSPSSSSP